MVFGAPVAPAAGAELCMSLPAVLLTGPSSQSFEEIRIADYLTAYRSTGRPPPPVPAFPAEPAVRAAQGLPPLFAPTPFPADPSNPPTASSASSLFGPAGSGMGAGSSSGPFGVGGSTSGPSAGANASTITDPARLPLTQGFPHPVPVQQGVEREAFVSISAAPEYAHFSPEELRYYAYLRNTRAPPAGTPAFTYPSASVFPNTSASGPTLLNTAYNSSTFPSNSNPNSNLNNLNPGLFAAGGGVGSPGDRDQLQSISARPEFAGHSVEVRFVLRFAFCVLRFALFHFPRSRLSVRVPCSMFSFLWALCSLSLVSSPAFGSLPFSVFSFSGSSFGNPFFFLPCPVSFGTPFFLPSFLPLSPASLGTRFLSFFQIPFLSLLPPSAFRLPPSFHL
ncbi:hypothetical protein B0H11DRAFT_2069095 [Mycena galericulata]|nr:hypothetical protein B0H11DRAFT_2069095 [Mycena galericulata]